MQYLLMDSTVVKSKLGYNQITQFWGNNHALGHATVLSAKKSVQMWLGGHTGGRGGGRPYS